MQSSELSPEHDESVTNTEGNEIMVELASTGNPTVTTLGVAMCATAPIFLVSLTI